ncbi:MAG: glyoxalase [Kordiimonadales bacterium]|nr:MAG: glyoxalase [Kordiimonadales bacterium]
MPSVAREETEAPLTLDHIGFSVSKLDASVSFFVDTLGWKRAGGRPDYPAVFVSNGAMFITLWQVENPETATPFDRRANVGLHHMAITVGSLQALHALHQKFIARGDVVIEFSPEFAGKGPRTHMMVREPSGLRLEFVVPASKVKQNVGFKN